MLTKNVRAVATDHRVAGIARVTRIAALITTETVKITDKKKGKTIDRIIVALKKVVNLATTSKMRIGDLHEMRQVISRMIREENVLTIKGMNARAKMIRMIMLQMVKGATREIVVIGKDLTGANEFARKKSQLQ